MSMNPSQQWFGQQGGFGQGHNTPRLGRVIGSRSVELSDASQLPEAAARVASVPGLKFSAITDPITNLPRVTVNITALAAQRMNEVRQVHEYLNQAEAKAAEETTKQYQEQISRSAQQFGSGSSS